MSSREVLQAATIEDLLIAVATPDFASDSPVRKAAWDEIKARLAAAHRGLRRALDFQTVSENGLAIKQDVREALIRSGSPPGEWGTVGGE
jgi:hypothetical protein